MPRAFAALALAAFLAVGSACGAQVQRPSIRIVGSEVVGSELILKVKIKGWKLVPPDPGAVPKPRTGQWQIFTDKRYAGYSFQPQYGFVVGLSAGTYRFWVALARTDYSLVYPLIRSQDITVHIGRGTV